MPSIDDSPRYLPTSGRARLAIVGLGGCAALCLLSAGLNGWLRTVLVQLQEPDALDDIAVVSQLDSIVGIASVLNFAWVLCMLLTAIFFCRWLHRAYANLDALVPGRRLSDLPVLDYTPRRAVSSFFIPLVNLVRPFKVLRELWRHSAPSGTPGGSNTLVSLWWGAWLLAGLVAHLGDILADGAGFDLSSLQGAAAVSGFAELLFLAAATLAIAMVRGIEARQTARAHWLAALVPGRVSPARVSPAR